MRWPWQRPEPEYANETVAELFIQSQTNLLNLAQAMLAIIDNPDLIDEDLREECIRLISDLGDGLAVLTEHVVV